MATGERDPWPGGERAVSGTDCAKPVSNEESLGSIKEFFCRFDIEMKTPEARCTEELARLESLESELKKFDEDTKHLDGRLNDIEHRIEDLNKCQDTACSLQDKQESDSLERELQNIEERFKCLLRDVEIMQNGGHSNTDQLVKRVYGLTTKASQIKALMFTSITQNPSQRSVNLMPTGQHQKASNGAQMVKRNPIFQHLQHCLQWLDSKQTTLMAAWYDRDKILIKQALVDHGKEHQSIQDYRKEVDLCIKEWEKLDKKEQTQCSELLSKVKEAWRELMDCSLKRQQSLQSLLDFVQAAEQEIDWAKKKIEQICNCSKDLLNMSCEQIHQDVCTEIKSQLAHFISVLDDGHTLVSQTHPANVAIEAFILDMKSHWSWLKLFLECLNIHNIRMSEFLKFFQEAQRCETWMNQSKKTIDKWTGLQNLSLGGLQKIQKECHDLQIDLVRYNEDITSLQEKSCNIIPFNKWLQDVTFKNKVLCLCNYEQPNMSLQSGEECTVLDNSQKVRWKVRNARGQEDMVPSICLLILPPNSEAVDLAEKLKMELDELKTLLRNMTQNIVLSQIQLIKTLPFKSQDLPKLEDLLRNLNHETSKLIAEVGETDQEMQHLQKEIKECNQGFHTCIRELQNEVKSKNKTCDEDLLEKLETYSHQLNTLYQDLKCWEKCLTSVDKNTIAKAFEEQNEWEKTIQQQESCIKELTEAMQKLPTRNHQMDSCLMKIIQMWNEMTDLGKKCADRLRSLADIVQDQGQYLNIPTEKQVLEVNTQERINSQPHIASDPYGDINSTKVQRVEEKTWNSTGPSEGFALQWEKFEMRFEIRKVNHCITSKNHEISDISPVQMQYISDIEAEKNALLQKFSEKNLKGVFESNLLHILLEEEHFGQWEEHHTDFSYLKKAVITILKSHLQENPPIEEKYLSQFTLKDVQEAHELQDLECVVYGTVNIYLSRSEKGVSIVGRRIGQCIESINSTLEQRSKNKPASRRTCYTAEGALSNLSEPKWSKRKYTGSEQFEISKEMAKAGKASESEKYMTLTKSTVQMLRTSTFQAEISKNISVVSVVLNTNKVIFQGTPEAVQKAEAYLVQHLKLKGYWHEVDETASFIEICKRLNFEDYLKERFPNVAIVYSGMKIIFIGESCLAIKEELNCFKVSIHRCVVTFDNSYTLNYLKLPDIQMYIWKQFEKKHILCFWQVNEANYELFLRNNEQFAEAKKVIEDCIAFNEFHPSTCEFQEIEAWPPWMELYDQNKGMLHKEVFHGDCVIYVGMPEVIKQFQELYLRLVEKGNESQRHSLPVHLSQPVLSYIRKYLMENIKQNIEVDCILLEDLSGIMITGSKESVQEAVCEVKKWVQQLSIDVCPINNPEMAQTATGQVKVIVNAVEEENKTIIDIISLSRKGEDTVMVPFSEKLDVYLVYGSTSRRDTDMQLIPVNDRLFPFCIAAIDIMEKGVDLLRKAATCFEQYVTNKEDRQKPIDFMFIPDDTNHRQCIVYFVMPDNPSDIEDFEQKFKDGLMLVFDYARQRKIMSVSLPLEMHEQLPVRQMFTIIMDILKIYTEKAESQERKKEVFLCSVDRTDYSIIRTLLEKETLDEDTLESFVMEEDFYDRNDKSDSEVNITIITGNLTEQKVDIIVNSTSPRLTLDQGYISQSILDAAGSTIQDECREKYPKGIGFGEIAVTAAGNLGCQKIFHGALHRKDEKYLQTIRWLMKNCLRTAGKEKLHSIAFPALGIGKLEYPVEVVAKEMFQAVTQSAKQYGVKTVKFVLQKDEKNTYQIFQKMAEIRECALRDAENPDFNPKFEIYLEACRLKVHIVATEKKSSICDVDVFLSSPPAGTQTDKVTLEGLFGAKTILKINRNPDQWGERLYLCWNRAYDLKQGLVHVVEYMKMMKFTSFAVYLVCGQDLTLQDSQSAIEAVILTLDTKKPFDDLKKVTVIVSHDMYQQMIPWLKGKTHESMNWTTTFWKKFFSSEVKTIWTDLQSPLPKTMGTYIRVTGSNQTTVQTSLKKILEAALPQTPQKQEGRKTYSQSPSSTVTESFMNIVYEKFNTEVAQKVLKAIKHSCGENGIHTLVMELKEKAQVEEINGKVHISCDFKHANDVQQCVFRNYKRAKGEDKTAYNTPKKHLIDDENSEMKELLQFAYGETDWSKKLQVEEGKLYLFASLNEKKEVEAAVQTVSLWCQEDFFLSSDEQKKAAEAMRSVKKEFPAIFITQISNRVIMKGDNTEKKFEKAKHKMKVALGRIKITSTGRSGRNLKTDDESFSSLSQDDRKEASPLSLPLDLPSSKIYYTREGITVKVYIGDIVRLPVDCIVNAANKNLSHGGGVALAIAKAAGREFDQESEEYIRKHGPVSVTQCCVTSAGQLPYAAVIHVVGPQWHEYKQDEKDRCGDDLKKTIVNCLIEANRRKMSSIAIPSISSGIFGVPKQMCTNMYAMGVYEFSKMCGLQYVKEIHFVDRISELCQLTQLAFETEFKNPSKNPEPSRDTSQSYMDKLAQGSMRHSQVLENFLVKTQNVVKVTKTQHSYVEFVAAGDQMRFEGNKQYPYAFKPLDSINVLIYDHDITDVTVDGIVCPVSHVIEGCVVKSVNQLCGSGIYSSTITTMKNVGDVRVRIYNKQNLRFKFVIYVYSPHWFSSEDKKYVKEFDISMENIFQETRKYALKSLAIPIHIIGDEETPVDTISEYMMNGILDFCSKPDTLPLTIHLVTNDSTGTLAYQLKEMACDKFKQNLEGKGHSSWKRSVKHSKSETSGLHLTVRNNNPLSLIPGDPASRSQHGNMGGHEDQMDTCPICMDTPSDPVAFNKCRHVLCRQCMELTMKNKPVCPMCGMVYGIITGSQPPGTMKVRTTSSNLPGFDNCGTIEIFYSFPGGIQTDEHPKPGKPYQGTKRRAYLPDNMEGRKVQSLLRKAFDRRLVFTVGRSVTTGAENTVTWNDIHHKTNKDGGPQNYGYPDPDYLRRVQVELADKGVTEDS